MLSPVKMFPEYSHYYKSNESQKNENNSKVYNQNNLPFRTSKAFVP